MPTPSKFTADARKIVLEALRVGASLRTAAALARISHPTLLRWLDQGKNAEEGTRFREFYLEAEAAMAHPRERALGIIYREMPDRPDLAWKFAERREPGYSPPMPQVPAASQGPVIIQLALSGGAQLALAEPVIEGEVVDEQDLEPEPAPNTPA